MKTSMKKVFVVIIMILTASALYYLVGCLTPYDPGTDTGGKGFIKIEVPAVAPWLGAVKARPTAASSDLSSEAPFQPKSFLVVSEMRLKLFDAGGSLVDETQINPDAFGGSNTYSMDWEVPSGGPYTLEVEVYNLISDPLNPAVFGEESGINVPDGGSTSVTVTCFPYDPVSVTEGVLSSTYTLASGGEMWFTAVPTEGNTSFSCESITGDLDLYVFGSDGVFMSSSLQITALDQLAIQTTPSATYYMGIYAETGGEFTVYYEPLTTDIDLSIMIVNVSGDGTDVTVEYEIQNIGSEAAGSFEVDIWEHLDTPPVIGIDASAYYKPYNGLAAGGSINDFIEIPSALTSGTAYATVDTTNTVVEVDETNNVTPGYPWMVYGTGTLNITIQ